MGRLNIASLLLLLGAMGQYWFRRSFPNIPDPLAWSVVLLPWVVTYAGTFCKVPPPIGPRAFRYCLLGAMCWYGAVIIIAETMYIFKTLPPYGHFPITLARVLMYVGFIAFIPFTQACVLLRRLESELKNNTSA